MVGDLFQASDTLPVCAMRPSEQDTEESMMTESDNNDVTYSSISLYDGEGTSEGGQSYLPGMPVLVSARDNGVNSDPDGLNYSLDESFVQHVTHKSRRLRKEEPMNVEEERPHAASSGSTRPNMPPAVVVNEKGEKELTEQGMKDLKGMMNAGRSGTNERDRSAERSRSRMDEFKTLNPERIGKRMQAVSGNRERGGRAASNPPIGRASKNNGEEKDPLRANQVTVMGWKSKPFGQGQERSEKGDRPPPSVDPLVGAGQSPVKKAMRLNSPSQWIRQNANTDGEGEISP